MKFKIRKTGEIINSDMMFINDYSDWGSASLNTTLKEIEKDYEIIFAN